MAFQRIRLINLRSAGIFGDYTLNNFTGIFTSEGFWSSLLTTLIYSVFGTASAIVLGLIAALALRKAFRGRTFVRAAMLLPYVAPIVAATFAWSTMLNPQFGIVNYWGQRLLGWEEPIAFLSSAPGGPDHGDRLRGVAVVPVRLLVPDRPAAGRPGNAGGSSARRRRHADPALRPRRAAAVAADHRRADRAALHLDVQQLRRHLPAHRRWRRHRGRQRPGLQRADLARRHRRRLRAGARAGPDPGRSWSGCTCADSGPRRRRPDVDDIGTGTAIRSACAPRPTLGDGPATTSNGGSSASCAGWSSSCCSW